MEGNGEEGERGSRRGGAEWMDEAVTKKLMSSKNMNYKEGQQKAILTMYRLFIVYKEK